MSYGDKSCVAEMSNKWSKGGLSDIFHKSKLILGSITASLVVDKALEQPILVINVGGSAKAH